MSDHEEFGDHFIFDASLRPGQPAKDGFLYRVATGESDRPLEEKHGVLKYFRHFLDRDVEARLRANNINFTQDDAVWLYLSLLEFENSYDVRSSQSLIDREERILSLSVELHDLLLEELRNRVDEGNSGQPIHWRSGADGNDLDTVPILKMLGVLVNSSKQALTSLKSGIESPAHPQGNRAKKVRHHYWLFLLAFWTTYLGRKIGVSTKSNNDPSGPLIRFIRAMSEGGLPPEDRTDKAIKSWVIRNMNSSDSVSKYIVPIERGVYHHHVVSLEPGK